ncbi:hypothetical protein Tco_1383876 [Tanacetum coccineum]
MRTSYYSWKPCQVGYLNLPDHRLRRWSYDLIPAESDSLSHAHAQARKTIISIKIQESRKLKIIQRQRLSQL